MRIATLAITIGLTLLGTIAPAQQITYDYNPAASFLNYRTYAWTRGTELIDPLLHQRVVRAVDAALMTKRLAPVNASDHPDLLVAYHASFEKDLEISGSTVGMGPFGLGGDRWGAARIQPVLVGTLVVDLVDPRTNAIVWRSLASSDIRPSDKPETRDKKVTKAAEKMFRNYPPKASR